MSVSDWLVIVVVAAACLAGEILFGCAWFFSPGWANGGPFGLSFQTVLSTALTGWISVMLMTAATTAGAIVGFFCAALEVGQRHARRVYHVWLWFAGVVILGLSIWVFLRLYSSIWKEFPNGYVVL